MRMKYHVILQPNDEKIVILLQSDGWDKVLTEAHENRVKT